MSIEQINNGDTGLKARATINSTARAVQLAAGGRRAIIDTFGDSIAGAGSTGLWGVFASAAMYWSPGLNIQMRTNYGVGGTLSSALNASQLPSFQAAITGGTPLPDIVAIQTYSNDSFSTAAAADTMFTNQTTFATSVLQMGVPLVILCSALPKSAGSDPIGRMALNAKIARFCDTTPGCVFFDWYSSAVDPSSTSTSITPWNSTFGGYSTDGTHPLGNASFYGGRTMANILKNIVGCIEPRTMASLRYDDAGENTRWYSFTGPEGNFLGTGGQLNAVNNTGVAGSAASADNRWQITTPAGVTVTPSIVTDSEGRRNQRMALSGTPSGAGTIQLRYAHSYLPSSEARYAAQAILNVTSLAGIREFSMDGYGADALGPSYTPAGTGVFPTHSGLWFLRTLTEPPLVSAHFGSKNIDIRLEVVSGVPVSGTVDVSRVYEYRVV